MTAKLLSVALVLMAVVPNVTVAQTWRTMKKGALIASDETTLKMAIEMWGKSDFEAMGQLHALGRLDITWEGKGRYCEVHMLAAKPAERLRSTSNGHRSTRCQLLTRFISFGTLA